MPKFACRRRRDRKGATAVEFAMVMMPLIFMTLGVLDMMLMYSAWSTIQWSCDSAARQVMVATTPTVSQAQSFANAAAISAGYSNGGTSTINFSGTTSGMCGTSSNTCILVTGTYTYYFKLTTAGRASVTLTAKAYAPIMQ